MLAGLSGALPARTQQTDTSEGWTFQLTPYLWGMGVKAELQVGLLPELSADASFSDILKSLHFAMMGSFEGRKGRWGFLFDGIYFNLTKTVPTPEDMFGDVKAGIKEDVFSLAGTFRAVEGQAAIDIIGGMRYFYSSADLELTSGTLAGRKASASKSWVDGFVGTRLQFLLAKTWTLVGYADVGAGGSRLSWQALAGLDVKFSRVLSGKLGYRYFYLDREKDSGLITLGGQARGSNPDLQSNKTGPSADFLLVYGTPFTGGQPRQPFDYFPVEFTRRFQDRAYLTIYGYSLLLGKEMGVESGKKLLLGLFQHYDYINTETIELGGSSLCAGLVSRFQLSKTSQLTITPQLGWMILGVSNNEYVLEDLRDYNFGTGLTAKLDAFFNFQKYGNRLFRWAHYSIYALEGAKGTDRLNVFTGEYRIPVWKQVMVGLQYQHYRRNSDYRDFPDVVDRFAPHLGAGLDWALSDWIVLNVDARYSLIKTWVEELPREGPIGEVNPDEVDQINLNALTLTVGLKFYF